MRKKLVKQQETQQDKQQETQQEKQGNNNQILFPLNLIYPDAKKLFQTHTEPIEQIKDNCYIVLDTNVLLIPYKTGTKSIEEIKELYSKLIREKRLKIPGQVVREFVKNRPDELKNLYSSIETHMSSIQFSIINNYPLLEPLDSYKKVKECGADINKSIKCYRENVKTLLEDIQNWNWNDPVSSIYSNLFRNDVILDLPLNEDFLQKDLKQREMCKIPPGYQDKNKPDNPGGDYLIWLTILEIGKTHNKDIIFVTSEEKNDWWYKSNNRTLYPRFELLNEFKNHSGGKSFYIKNLADFLSLYGVNKDIVEEVRKEEIKESAISSSENKQLYLTFLMSFKNLEYVLRNSGINKPNEHFNVRNIMNKAYNYNLIDEELRQKMFNLIKIRNVILHVPTAKISLDVFNKAIADLNEITMIFDKIKNDFYIYDSQNNDNI